MKKHRHLPLIVGFLMMTATAAARQSSAPAGQSNTAGSPSNTTDNPFSTTGSPFNSPFGSTGSPSNSPGNPSNTTGNPSNTTGSPFNTPGSPFSTPGSPFGTPGSPFGTTASPSNTNAGQVKTAKPGQPVERNLSEDQKFREWSLNGNVPDDIKRIKVCRVEEVCKMRFKDGETPRMRVRNLVLPLRYDDENTAISEAFTRQVLQAFDDLREKRGVTVRFIGYTDNAPLTGANEQTYGDQLALSKAMARRVATAMQEKLGLPASAIESDGRGDSRPVASNDTALGRALNRRIEVEFWYDDPLQELSDEPQLCPDYVDETMTRIYDPAWGSIPPLELANGQPIIPPDYAANLRRAQIGRAHV